MNKKSTNEVKTKSKKKDEKYSFNLFISGETPNAERAILNLKFICKKYLKGKYKIKIVDLQKNPVYTIIDQIVAAPTLVRKYPLPVTKLVGDLSNIEKVLNILNIKNDIDVLENTVRKKGKKRQNREFLKKAEEERLKFAEDIVNTIFGLVKSNEI
ncbi:MAG: hypothetical protein EHM58_10785 [Ignavibacteriae bacterium]|nr:MAG: hypothetical protein EHM58_10785 [Ignavibacteriota bacterium]